MSLRTGGAATAIFICLPDALAYFTSELPGTLAVMLELAVLHDEIRACRKCLTDGFPISPPPLVWGEAPAPFLLIGQAPGISDWRGDRMYLGPAAKKLIGWLKEAGFRDEDIGTTLYMTALTKCFPGRLLGKSTDRAPSPKERANCRPWLDVQLALVRPLVIILFGKLAIDTFLPRMPLEQAVGNVFEQGGITYIPLPHSSGASTWLNDAGHRELRTQAIERVREARLTIIGWGADARRPTDEDKGHCH